MDMRAARKAAYTEYVVAARATGLAALRAVLSPEMDG